MLDTSQSYVQDAHMNTMISANGGSENLGIKNDMLLHSEF